MFAWRVSDNQVQLRSDAFLNSYGGWHAKTLQWCFHSNEMSIISHNYVSTFWLQSHILGCGLDRTPMFWNAKPAGRQCNVLRMRVNPGWSTWMIMARKHLALAGCKIKGAVYICKTIHFLTKSFITNEQYEPRNSELCYFVHIFVSIYLST